MNAVQSARASIFRNQVFLAVGVVSVASGLWAYLSQSWSLPYQVDLLVHPALAMAWGAAAFLTTVRARRAGSGSRAVQWTLLILALGLPGMLRSRPAAGLAAGTILAAIIAPAARRPGDEPFVVRATTFLTWKLYFLAVYAGIEIFVMAMGRSARAAFWLHRTTSLAFVAALAANAAVQFAVRAPEARRRRLLRQARLPATLAILSGVVIAIDAHLGGPSFTLHLSTLPMAQREPVERITPFAMARPELLDQTESCGKLGVCHPAALEDHLKSAHNRSVMTPYFQKNLDLMIAEIGAENKNLCAGCHHPQSLFDARLGYKDFARRNNFSCVHCHAVSAVSFPPDARRTVVRLTPNLRHLALLAPDATGLSSSWARFLVQLYPDGHGRALKSDLLFSDAFCQACHRLQIKPTKDTGLSRARCIDCHMQPRSAVGLSGSGMNHRFPGSNTAVPYANRDFEQLEFTRRFVEGGYPLRLDAWGQVGALEGDTAIRRWLEMHYEPRAAPAPGKLFPFVIWTANVGVDHAFPAAPLDLIDAWLEVSLTDADGRVVFASGALGPGGLVPADAHRLGGYMIGEDGQPVQKNRVWQIAKKVIVRQIEFGQRVADGYETTLPANVKGPLTLAAAWNYRKLNQEFVGWALGPQETMPVVKVASLRWTIPLSESPVRLPDATDAPPTAASGPHESPAVHP